MSAAEQADEQDNTIYAEVHYKLPMDADDVVRGLNGNDDKVFMFIMQILEHEDVSIEVRDRLIEELTAPIETMTGETP